MARKSRGVRISTREKLAIVEAAIRLIREPSRWIKGKWECRIGETRRGVPIYAFCLDGAIARATITVLGPRRARLLGVDDDDGAIEDGGLVGELLSVRKLAYDALVERGYFINYSFEHMEEDDQWQVVFNDYTFTTYEDVLALLRRKARELRAAVKRLDARRAK